MQLNQLNVINCPGLRSINVGSTPAMAYLSTYGSGVNYLDIQNNPHLLNALGGTVTAGTEYVEYAGSSCYMRVNPGTEFSGTGCLPIDEAHFPDGAFRAYVADSLDANGSGWLSPAEIAAVTEIICSGAGISDLTGIGIFTELTCLECADSQLTTLDLGANTQLDTVDCTNNPNLTSLYTGSLGLLTDLACSGCGLTSLDLSGVGGLSALYCDGNVFDSIDITACPALLDAWYNGTVTETDTYMQYTSGDGTLRIGRGMNVVTPGLPVDAARFPDPVFRAYVTDSFDADGSGYLSAAEIAGATEINGYEHTATGFASLQGIGCLTELTYISFSDSPDLTTLDLSANTKLQCIDIWDTGLTSLNLTGLPLQEVLISRCPLSSLTLGAQPSLINLSVTGAALSELDNSGCPFLLSAWRSGDRTTEGGKVTFVDASWNVLNLDLSVRLVTGVTPESFLTLPAVLTEIGSEAFTGVAAEAVRIPASVAAIEGDPFAGSRVRFVYGTPGSAAQSFAEANGYIFVPVGD